MSSWILFLLVTLTITKQQNDEIPSQSPTSSNFQFCATSKYMKQALSKNATWKQSLDDANREWIQYTSQNAKSAKLSYPFIEIPIIWHALNNHNEIDGYVTDEMIASQIHILNNDYNGFNRNYDSGTPLEFRFLRCGVSGIKFKLHTMIRKYLKTSYNEIYADSIKKTDESGSDPVDPAKYLNIWTAPLFKASETGSASKPGGPANLDGVVLHPAVIGDSRWRPIDIFPEYNGGRVATHEIGHWLGLEEIWGDNDECVNVEDISDYVLDTPAHRHPNYFCPMPGTIKSCPTEVHEGDPANLNPNVYSQDMYMNFMDLTDDDCKSMFTLGQCDRMWFMIRQFRPALLKNDFAREVSDISFVSWLYFRRFESFEHIEDSICFEDEHVLFYANNINNETDSNIFIFGCLVKTQNMRISHIIDIQIVYKNGGCNDGYTQSSQDLNEGNNGSSIYLCYLKEDSMEDKENMAVLDITFVTNNDVDTNRLDTNEGWEVNVRNNINPNGHTLYLAVKLGPYLTVNDNDDGLSYTKIIKLFGILSMIALIICVIICIVTKLREEKSNKYELSSPINEYGATIEITHTINFER